MQNDVEAVVALAQAVRLNPTVLTIVEALGPELRSYPVSKQDLPEVRKFGALFGSLGKKWRLTPLGLSVQSALRAAKGEA